MTFGQFLADCRIAKGLTQRELAAMLYVGESAVSKWEKDKRKPDIELVSRLSEIFGISEGELIRASIDKTRIKEKREARNFRIINNTYNLVLYIGFSIALLVCFIVNLAVSHTLSWFFIVFSALILAGIILILPQYIKKFKLLIIPLSWLLGLYLLLGVICIYEQAGWFFIPAFALLLSYSILFAPLLIRVYLPQKYQNHNALLSISADLAILVVMLVAIDLYTFLEKGKAFGWSLADALPIVAFWAVPIYLTVLVSAYTKINSLFMTAAIIFIWLAVYNVFMYALTPLLNIQPSVGHFWKADLTKWSNSNDINANVTLLINIIAAAIIVLFVLGGIALSLKSKKNRMEKASKNVPCPKD